MQEIKTGGGAVMNPAPNKEYFTVYVDYKGQMHEVATFENHLLRNPVYYVQSLLESAVMFQENEFTDLDCVREINGYLLNVEYKEDLNALLHNRGQLLLAINTAKVSKITHFFVEGTAKNPKRFFSISPFRDIHDIRIIQLTGAEDLKKRIRAWEMCVRQLPGIDESKKWAEVDALISNLRIALNPAV